MGEESKAGGDWSVAMGDHAKTGGAAAVSLGSYTKASAEKSAAIGDKANASGKSTIALGKGAGASGENSVALGDNATAEGKSAVAIGKEAKANGENSVAIGKDAMTSDNSYAFGRGATATGEGAIAIGNVVNADDTNVVVLGTESYASGAGAVVIGNNNTVTGEKNGLSHNIVAGHNLDVLGAHNAVFATDYPNYDTKETFVAGEQNTVLGVGNLVGYTAVQNGTEWNYTMVGDSGSDQNVAVGLNNTSNGGSVVVGTSSEAKSLGASFGHGNTIIGMDDGGGQWGVALGNNLTAQGEWATAVGNESKATADETLAMGHKATASGVSSTAIGSTSSAAGSYAIAMGQSANASANYTMALGYGAKASEMYATALGGDASVTVETGVALGAKSSATVKGGIKGYDPAAKAASTESSPAWKSTLGAVSVGDKEKGESRQITNVSAGMEDTDAVNVAQLKALDKKVENAAGKQTTLEAGDYVAVTEGTNDAGGKKYTVNGPKLDSTDGTVKITDKTDGNGKKIGYTLSVDTAKLGMKDTEVKAGDNVTVDTKVDGNKTTYTVKAKDTKLAANDSALKLTGNTLSMSVKDTAGNEVKGSVDLTAIAGEIDTNTTYTLSGKDNGDRTTTISLTGSDGKSQTVTVKDTDTRNTVKAGGNVTVDETKQKDGSSLYTVSVKADGKVEKGNTGLISGDTISSETRTGKGNYIKADTSAADNITALDKQIKTNSSAITNLGNTITNMQGGLTELDRNISKVGAGAAALAALHPLDYDPEDKWDIAAGLGNYKDATAAAVGMFYRPNERTMISVGTTMGDDRNLVNAGISVKLGSGKATVSKSAMASEIKTLKAENEDLKKEVSEVKAENESMKSDIETMKQQIAMLMKK